MDRTLNCLHGVHHGKIVRRGFVLPKVLAAKPFNTVKPGSRES